MAFVSNYELERVVVGRRLRLTRDIDVPKGRFLRGSIVTITRLAEPADPHREFSCRDEDSGERLGLTPLLGGYEPIL
jgi:hypothetical protein